MTCMLYMQAPVRRSQTHSSPSTEAEPAAEGVRRSMNSEEIGPVWPCRVYTPTPSSGLNTLMVWSCEPVRSLLPCRARQVMAWVWALAVWRRHRRSSSLQLARLSVLVADSSLTLQPD